MQDRVPLYPGRVMLTPVPGQENTFDMIRADSPTQEGTPLNKANLLKDATAVLFGLGTDAVPDEVLSFLGKYAQHWWKRRTISFESVTNKYESFYISYASSSSQTSTTHTIYYSDSVTIDGSGNVTLSEPINSISSSYNDGYSNVITAVRGKYVKNNADPRKSSETIYKVSESASLSYQNGGPYYRYIGSCGIVSSKVLQAGDWGYYQSNNRNAYPDCGISNFYENDYIGIPLDNAASSARIETGSYVGTGRYGETNKNEILFDRIPVIVIVSSINDNDSYSFTWIEGVAASSTVTSKQVYSRESNKFIWYSTNNAQSQLNTADATYFYVAVTI